MPEEKTQFDARLLSNNATECQRLLDRLKTARDLPENSAFKPQLNALIVHCEYLNGLFEHGSSEVKANLWLIEDALDKKLTHQKFKQRLLQLSSDESPLFAKLSLILAALGLALAAAGILMTPAGVPFIAAGAVVQTTVVSGTIVAMAGVVGFFSYNPRTATRLMDDFGRNYYNAAIPSNG